MTTGQAPITIKTGNALDQSDELSNVATNQADLAATRANNVDDKDIYPRSVTTGHLSASDGIFHGTLKTGSIIVGPEGVVVTSDENGGVPANGLYIGAAMIELLKAGKATIVLDGNTGVLYGTDFQLTTGPGSVIHTSENGSRVQFTDNGLAVIDGFEFTCAQMTTDGHAVKSKGGITAGNAERYSFLNSAGTEYASLFLDTYNTNKMLHIEADEDGCGIMVQASLGPLYLSADDNIYLLSNSGVSLTNANASGQIPLIDYGTAAVATGTSQTGLAVVWTSTQSMAPTTVMAISDNKLINCAVTAFDASGATIDWASIDGTSQSGNVTAMGYWF